MRRAAGNAPRAVGREQAAPTRQGGLQRETNEADVDVDTRWGIRAQQQQWDSCCGGVERFADEGRHMKGLSSRRILDCLEFSQDRQVLGTEFVAGGESAVSGPIMPADLGGFTSAGVPEIVVEAAGVRDAHEDGEQPERQYEWRNGLLPPFTENHHTPRVLFVPTLPIAEGSGVDVSQLQRQPRLLIAWAMSSPP